MTLTITLTKDVPSGAVTVRGLRSDDVEAETSAALLEAASFKGKVGDSATVPAAPSGDDSDDESGGARTVEILVGLGADDERTATSFLDIGGAIARAAAKHGAAAVDHVLSAVGDDVKPADAARALAEGLVLGAYSYTELKSDAEQPDLAEVSVIGTGGKRVQAALDEGRAIAEAICVARDMVNEPGGTMTATAFAKKATDLAGRHGFDINVLGPREIKAAKMGGLLGVNRGSEQPPRFLELSWTPEGRPRGRVALVGKGVTFDSGGLSLKTTAGMLTMKMDMSGAAAVLATFCALGATQPRVEVRGYLPLTDNMTGGDATRVGDVLRISNGKTVEVQNTDAEGRLILADGLVSATNAEPDAIIDIATLTGACMVALGKDRAGVMGNTDSWIDQILVAAEAAGEKVWQLPLPSEWRDQLDSDVADIKNIGGREGGASTAALFLSEFVGDGIPWVHIDIAGPAFADSETPTTRKGGTGFGVATLLQVLRSYKRPR